MLTLNDYHEYCTRILSLLLPARAHAIRQAVSELFSESNWTSKDVLLLHETPSFWASNLLLNMIRYEGNDFDMRLESIQYVLDEYAPTGRQWADGETIKSKVGGVVNLPAA